MNERHIIAKNAHELFQRSPELFKGRLDGIPAQKDWKFVYE